MARNAPDNSQQVIKERGDPSYGDCYEGPHRGAAAAVPYPPSWYDRLTDWVERLPIPWWSFYLVLVSLLGEFTLFFWPLAIFLWPPPDLSALKKSSLSETGARARLLAKQLHVRIDELQLSRIDEVHKAIVALEYEGSRLLKVPTWPWNPGTLRALLAIIFLPLLLRVATFVLDKLLN